MTQTLITLVGCLAALGLTVFMWTLALAIFKVFATAIRLGPAGSSQVRRVNYLWFRRVRRVFYIAFALGWLFMLLQALHG